LVRSNASNISMISSSFLVNDASSDVDLDVCWDVQFSHWKRRQTVRAGISAVRRWGDLVATSGEFSGRLWGVWRGRRHLSIPSNLVAGVLPCRWRPTGGVTKGNPLSLRELMSFRAPRVVQLNELLMWSPDVFAVVASVLRRHGA
jgi:hypothetical protein